MATKIGPSSVSYGIGVQNRYSAFLDEEDGFSSAHVAASIQAKRADQLLSKQKSSANGAQNLIAKPNNNSLVSKSNNRNGANHTKQPDQQQQLKSVNQVEPRQRFDGKRQRAGQQQNQQSTQSLQMTTKLSATRQQHGNNNQDNSANNRFVRSQPHGNQHHQTNVSHSPNKENTDINQQGKFVRNNQVNGTNNQRFGPNRRQFYNDTSKGAQQNDDVNVSSGNNIGLYEEEKRRRQQKRALDLKYKDSKKREARRPQVNTADQVGASVNHAEQAQGELIVGPKGQKNRRQNNEGTKNFDEGSKGTGAVRAPRGRREQLNSENNGEPKRDGQQINRNSRGNDRPQRNRNGFGQGSRGSRGSRGDDQGKFGSERQKQIPNFSDKLDFPSLAS